jgi:hypothetical protein
MTKVFVIVNSFSLEPWRAANLGRSRLLAGSGRHGAIRAPQDFRVRGMAFVLGLWS